MAEIRSIYTDKRKAADRNRQAYVNGAAVRNLRVADAPGRERGRGAAGAPRLRRVRTSKQQYLSIGYTIFLTLASLLALWVCAGYLQLQADNTARAKNIAALEDQLADLETENNDEYNRVTSSVDLEDIRRIAIEELGMVYAEADQVVLYDNDANDYVKQYAEIPDVKGSVKETLGTGNR